MKVIWSNTAEERLDAIFKYYLKNVTEKIAKQIILEILACSKFLNKNPYIGGIEEILKERTRIYRFLVCNSYKIIYTIYENDGYILIADVFDTRQNPEKIKNLK